MRLVVKVHEYDGFTNLVEGFDLAEYVPYYNKILL